MTNSIKTLFAGDFGSTMESLGFRKKGVDFRYGAAQEPQVMMKIQSQSVPGVNTAFLVDVGLMPQPLLNAYRWLRGEPVSDLEFHHFYLRNRINPPDDVALRLPVYSDPGSIADSPESRVSATQEWAFATNDEAEHCSRRLAMKMQQIVPQLLDLLDPIALAEFVSRPKEERGELRSVLPDRAMIVATMLAQRPPSPELDAAIDELKTRKGRQVLDWVELQQRGLIGNA